MKKYTGLITLFTITILISPLQAEAAWWKLIRNMAFKSIATEMLKEGESKEKIQNTCHLIAMNFAYTYLARINGMSREIWNNKLNEFETNIAVGGMEEQLLVKISKLNVILADHIYNEPMSTFPVNLESTIEEKQRSASDSGSEMYQECMSGLYLEL